MVGTFQFIDVPKLTSLQERLVASKYSREGITVDMWSKGYMEVSKGPLSVASVKQKGRQWHIFQANVRKEKYKLECTLKVK